MSSARDRDLERWEQGGLSMSELLALHGSEGAAGLVLLHRRMSALGKGPVGDPEAVWRAIRERLPDLAGPRRTASLRRKLTRPLAIAAAAVLIAGTAYAGSPDAVQRYLTSFWHRVQAVLDVDVDAPADTDRPSQGGGKGDRPAGSVDDAELEDRDEDDASEDGDQPGETSENDGGADDDEAEGDDGNGFDDDGEGTGDDDGEEPEDDDEGDEPNDDGDEPEEDGNEPEGDGNEPEGDDEGD